MYIVFVTKHRYMELPLANIEPKLVKWCEYCISLDHDIQMIRFQMRKASKFQVQLNNLLWYVVHHNFLFEWLLRMVYFKEFIFTPPKGAIAHVLCTQAQIAY
jgi:hypothetical protein